MSSAASSVPPVRPAAPAAAAAAASAAAAAASAAPAAPAACPSECTPAASAGAWLFRHRGWLPVPLLLLALLVPGHAGQGAWALGLALIAVGEAIRLAGVATAGTVTRRRSRVVQRLVDHGPFAWVRNPLYVGNLAAWLGMSVLSGVPWLALVGALLFAIEYSLIVRWEEGVLESCFGPAYLAYKARVPRWFPRPPTHAAPTDADPLDWPGAWKSEISTLLQYAVLLAAFALKSRYWG